MRSHPGGTLASWPPRTRAGPQICASSFPGAATTSGSGLDSHITPEAALFQVPRLSHARHLPEDRVRALFEGHVKDHILDVLGEPYFNALLLNLMLDALQAPRA